MSFVEVKQKKGMLKKYKKIFCKQFVRIKKKFTYYWTNEIWIKV